MANKLELTWYGKDEPIRVEPRLLIENAALSNTAADPDTEKLVFYLLTLTKRNTPMQRCFLTEYSADKILSVTLFGKREKAAEMILVILPLITTTSLYTQKMHLRKLIL